MIVDIQAVVAVALGLLCAVLYVLQNKKHLIHLASALQLVTDKKYTKRLIDTIDTQNFVLNARYIYNLMPLNEHTTAFAMSKSTMQTSITSEYIVISKSMVSRLMRMIFLPFIVSVLLREPFAFVGATIIGISTLVLYQTVFAHGKNYMQTIQIALILRHAYSYMSSAVTKLDASSISESFQHGPIQSLDNGIHVESNEESTSRQDYKTYKSSDTYIEKQQQLTWQRVWWVNDALFCLILIGMYWFATENSIEESIYGSIQIILFVQIFFVPVWFVITIAKRLLSNNSA